MLTSNLPSTLSTVLLGAGCLLALAVGLRGAEALRRPCVAVPPIDAAAPKTLETATFAMG